MTPEGGPLVVERRIQASPETVFGSFAAPRRWLQWQGLEAELDPRPGGVFRMNVRGDGWAVGRFLQVDPPPAETARGPASSSPTAQVCWRRVGLRPVDEDQVLRHLALLGLEVALLPDRRASPAEIDS